MSLYLVELSPSTLFFKINLVLLVPSNVLINFKTACLFSLKQLYQLENKHPARILIEVCNESMSTWGKLIFMRITY